MHSSRGFKNHGIAGPRREEAESRTIREINKATDSRHGLSPLEALTQTRSANFTALAAERDVHGFFVPQ